MRAIGIVIFSLVFLSVALAQSTVEDNWRITSFDMNGQEKTEFQWLTGGCFQSAVQNLNTEYKRDFEISMLGPSELTVKSIAEWKYTNEPVMIEECTDSCHPWQEELLNGSQVTHRNCTTSCASSSQDRWEWRWKPSKMHLIDGKSSTQKSSSINIGKGDTKLFKICADVPILSSGKFDVGVYDVGDAKLTLLDPWWNSSWARCRNLTITPNAYAATGARNVMVNTNISGLIFTSASEIVITNSSCYDGGFEVPRMIHNNNATGVNVSFIVNETLSAAVIYSIYYNNTGGTGMNLTGYTNESDGASILPLYHYHFEEGAGTSTANNVTAGGTGNMTLAGTTAWNDDAEFGLYALNGTGPANYGVATAPLPPNGTIEFWMKLDHDTTGVMSFANQYGSGTPNQFVGRISTEGGAGVPQISVNGGSNEGNGRTFGNPRVWQAGQWYHWVFQYGIGNNLLWIDDALEGNSTAVSHGGTGQNLCLGGYTDDDDAVCDYAPELFNGTIDEFRVFNHTGAYKIYGNVSVVTGTEEVYSEPAEVVTITIHHPDSGITYLNNTKTFNFTIVSSTRANINFTIIQNSTGELTDSVDNNTVYTIVLNMSKGNQTIEVIANATTGTISFNTIYENITSTAATTPTFEATNTTFNVSIESVYNVTNVRLSWNGTQFNATNQSASVWYAIQEMPVVYYNNTNVSYFWNFTVGAPTEYQNWTASATQLILYAYDFNATTVKNPALPTEGGTVEITSYILNHSPRDFLTVWLEFNGTTYPSTFHNISQNNLLYKVNISIPAVPFDNFTLNFSHNFSVSLGGISRFDNLTDSITLRVVNVTVCPNLSIEFLQLVAYEEENNTKLDFIDYEVLITYWTNISLGTRDFSVKAPNVTNVTFCMSPDSTQVTLNMTVAYQDALQQYSVRSWYLVNRTFNDTLHVERLYLLPSSASFYVDISVSDLYGVDEPGVTLKMQRYFYDDSLWRNVQVGLTDQAGATSVYLVRYDVPYRFSLWDGQNHLRTYTERTVGTPILLLKTEAEDVTTYNYWFGVRVGCGFDNSTKILTCNVEDPATKVTGWRLKVREQGLVDPRTFCDNILSGTTGTLTCDLSTVNTTGIFWTVYMTIDGFDYRVATGFEIISYPDVLWGDDGAMVALMIVLMAGAIGMWNPAVGMVMVFAGIALGSWSGIFPISPPILIALAAVVALMVYRMKA